MTKHVISKKNTTDIIGVYFIYIGNNCRNFPVVSVQWIWDMTLYYRPIMENVLVSFSV